MRNPSEAFMKALNKHLASRSVDDVDNQMLQDFMAQYNQELDMRGPLTEKTAQTADDYLELAENAPSKTKAIKYLKKACELDAENIDAELQLIDLTAKNDTEYLQRIEELLAKAKKQLEKEGYFEDDSIGEFWLMTETRPFMRVYCTYMDELMRSGKLRLAIEAGMDMLRLCENDNLGKRYDLMNCYAALEDEEAALALQSRYPDEKSTMFLLPLSVLFYRLGKEEQARQYLKELMEVNADTKKFFAAVLSGRPPKIERSPYGYRPGTIEEFEECVNLRPKTYGDCAGYWMWGQEQIKALGKTAKSKTKAASRRKK